MTPNTLFLRLQGPLQAWGDQQSKFVVRRTAEAPTKSGVLGLLCAALGVGRMEASREWLPALRDLRLGVRVDAPGVRWWDYHTVGADLPMRTAEGEGKTKLGALLTRREYLCDASFLVALHGDPALVGRVAEALAAPVWPLFLGRKSCPPSVPIFAGQAECADLRSALEGVAWQPRYASDPHARDASVTCPCRLEWRASADEPEIPDDAEVWYDAPLSFAPPVHGPRVVRRASVEATVGSPRQSRTPAPPRMRANYTDSRYQAARRARLASDSGLCVFCKAPATTVQHITYRRAGGGEEQDDLRSLCRLCHDAVTMLEYGLGMGLDRINPEDPRWRDRIIAKREGIVAFRSLETRRRHLAAEAPEEVE